MPSTDLGTPVRIQKHQITPNLSLVFLVSENVIAVDNSPSVILSGLSIQDLLMYFPIQLH